MSTETLEKDPAPAAIRYLVLVSAFTCLLTAFSFIQAQIGTSTTEEEFFQGAFVGFTFSFVISMVEWFALRRSRKMTGPYGFAFIVEIIKTLLFNAATIEYMENVSRATSSPFFLHQIISLGIIFMLALTKVARTRIDQLAQKDVSRHLLNLLPTILILTLFLGTYVTEIVGLGTPRQKKPPFEDYTDKNIDWSLYNTPTWDATYLLENLLDQFTAGMQFPNQALFNVTSDQSDPTYPPTYWRLGSLESYEYTDKAPYTTDWNPVTRGKRVLTPYTTGTPYSQVVSQSERAAQFTVELPLDHSESVVDVSINPSFPNYLPTTWNGDDGSYIDRDSFTLEDAYGNELTPTTAESRELYPDAYGDDFNDLLGIDANLVVDDTDTSSEEGIFEYQIDYGDLSSSLYTAATFSMTKDNYSVVLTATEWNDIKALYLQLPNETGTLPNPCHVDNDPNVPNPNNLYEIWAPSVSNIINSCTIPGQTVFSQAYADMQSLVPKGYIEGGSEEPLSGGGKYNLTFDTDMWLGNQNPLQAMAHPDEYEDYNEWFFTRKSGVSLHFASLLTTILRLRGIPSRVVVGYLGGDHTIDPSKRVITNYMLHAWSEVLVPIQYFDFTSMTLIEKAEWISFDPLLSSLAEMYKMDLPLDLPLLSQTDKTILIDPTYDHENNGPFAAQIANVTEVCITNDTDQILNVQQTLTVSVRLMMITSLALPDGAWMPWQPSCQYIGTKVTFKISTMAKNYTLGEASINGSGYASIETTYDVLEHGSPVWFLAEVTFDEGTLQEVKKSATSLRHRI